MSDVHAATWEALGTSVHVVVTDRSSLAASVSAIRDVMAEVDATYSRFRADSELMALELRVGQAVTVSPLLLEAIDAGIRAARATDGASDPTLGHVIRAVGYDRDYAALPADAPPPRIVVRRVPGWQAIEIDRARRSVRVPRGVGIDLGSTGKALAADIAAAAAHRVAGGGVLVNLGGDIATAGDPPAGGWRIRCGESSRDDPAAPGEVVAIPGGAVATSSTTLRRWVAGGRAMHHLIDPTTGLPTRGPWRTVSVAAATCVDANAASTAAIVKGEGAIGWLRGTGLPARLVGVDGAVAYVNGWPEPVTVAA